MSDKLPTIDDVRSAAEKAKAWRPDRRRFCPKSSSVYMDGWGCGCDACLGAKRAVEDIAEHVDDAMRSAKNNYIHRDMHWQVVAVNSADRAARIASYFASEPNPVSEFRDAVRAFVEAGK